MNIEALKDKYENHKTFQNVKTILKGINETLELTPVNYIHGHQYAAQFEQLCKLMLAKGKAHTKTDLINKLNLIVGLIRRFDPASKALANLRDKIDELRRDNTAQIPNAYPEHNAKPWKDMKALLQEEINSNPNKFAKIACVCFKHGYCLRIGEIFATTLKMGFPKAATNFLNLNELTWYIHGHKNARTTGPRKFTVTKEFVDELSDLIEMPEYLLIFKSNYEQYSTHLLSSIGITSFTNTELRNSYEQWSWNESGRTKEEATYWSENVLGHTVATALSYYTKHTIESKIMATRMPELVAEPVEEPAKPTKQKVKITLKPKPKA